jgi:hypothetical protein
MTVVTDGEYGTISSCPDRAAGTGAPVMRSADGRPDRAPFATVPLTPPRGC